MLRGLANGYGTTSGLCKRRMGTYESHQALRTGTHHTSGMLSVLKCLLLRTEMITGSFGVCWKRSGDTVQNVQGFNRLHGDASQERRGRETVVKVCLPQHIR